MPRLNRRQFTKSAAASTVFSLFTISGTSASGQVLGSNERIRHAVVGINGRGGNHLDDMAQIENVEVATLVDIDNRLFNSRSRRVEERGGKRPNCVQDYREMLDDPDIHSISIATCNHTHSLIAIAACQSGKHVYVEKPLSHNVWEGRQLSKAAKKYDRVVQHGTQARASEGRHREIAAVQSGKYGKLLVSKGYVCKPRWSIGYQPIKSPPAEVDFNLWLGPAPERPFHENLAHYNWHWFWDFGNGDLGNQGVHQTDVARWVIPDATHPTRIWSVGGRLGYHDQGETPSTLLTMYQYGDVLMIMETRGLVGDRLRGFPNEVTNEFYTTEGMIRDGKFYPNGGGQAEDVKFDGEVSVTPGGAFGSFFYAVRRGEPAAVHGNALEGHYSSSICHLGNIAHRLGTERIINSIKGEELGDHDLIHEAWAKCKLNLAAAGVDLEREMIRLGRVLEFDPQTEKFVNDEYANMLLSRKYREPFVVPAEV